MITRSNDGENANSGEQFGLFMTCKTNVGFYRVCAKVITITEWPEREDAQGGKLHVCHDSGLLEELSES